MDRRRHRAALEVNPATVARIRARYVVAGLDAAVYRQPPARSYRRRLDGEQEARLVALTCSAPPEGHQRWTLRLLADQLVALQGGRKAPPARPPGPPLIPPGPGVPRAPSRSG